MPRPRAYSLGIGLARLGLDVIASAFPRYASALARPQQSTDTLPKSTIRVLIFIHRC